ncbi:MAG: hypothetical protein ABI689_01965 [Thermoanaerobaculia bacterium]
MTRVFTPYSIAVSKTGDGTGRVTDDRGKIDCGTDCGGVYDLNAAVAVTATPTGGAVFLGWSGACTGAGPCLVTVDGAKSVVAAFTFQSADLAIELSNGVTSATPGESVTYTIVGSNAGPTPAVGASVSATFPPPLTCTWTCSGSGGGGCAASGSGSISDSVSLPAGSIVTYLAVCSIDPGATGPVATTAGIASPSGLADPVGANNGATDTDTLAPKANLSITKSDGAALAVPGQSTTYTIVASNAGPSHAPGSSVQSTFPAVLSCTWTCTPGGGGTCSAAGAGNITDTVSLPVGGSVTYLAACAIDPGATGSLAASAVVAAAVGVTDPSLLDNSAEDSDTLTPQADLAISKTDGVATAVPGESTTYTLVASNAGPSHAPGTTVTDLFPAGLACSWTCAGMSGGACTASGPGNINDPIHLPAGGSVTYTATCTISAEATGTLANTASIAPAAGVDDLVPSNNSATDTDSLSPQANLGITKTDGLSAAAPGQTTTYTIVASNVGPSQVNGATVADPFPASLTCNWTCARAGGGICAAAGSGSLNDAAVLPAGGSVTYTAVCAIAAGATGTLSNTATVSTTVLDPSPGNESATDTTVLSAAADIWLTKTAPSAEVGVGSQVEYTVEVGNRGPSTASLLTVVDMLPAGVTFVSAIGAGWSCTPGEGSVSCDRPSLDPQQTSSLAITVGAPLTPGELVNTASVSAATAEAVPGDESDAVTVQVIGPASIVAVGSVAATATGVISPGENTKASLTQLHLEASHELRDPIGSTDPHDATNPACYRLFWAPPGGTIASSTCADPTDVVIAWASYGVASARTVALYPSSGGKALPAGHYRLLACGSGANALHDAYGTPLDGDANGSAGDDFRRDFEVMVTNPLVNPNFDAGLTGWSVFTQTPGDVVHDAMADAADALTSGSVLLSNLTGLGSQLEVSQCIPGPVLDLYLARAQVRSQSLSATTPTVSARLEAFDGPTCDGAPLGTVGAGQIVGNTGGGWALGFPLTMAVPSGALSVRATFRSAGSELNATSWLDDLQIYGAAVFLDGFETGDASSWSNVVAQP